VAEFSNPAQRLAYLAAAATSEAVFSYMSGLIVKRDKWASVADPQEFMGSCWGHVARLFAVAKIQLRVCYVGEKWVDRRGDNDSFLELGRVNRLRIAVDGLHGLANRFFGHDSPEAAHIRRMVRNDLSLKIWLDVKQRSFEAPTLESRIELDRLVAECYCDSGFRCWFVRQAYRFIPVVAYCALRKIYKSMKRARQRLLPAEFAIFFQ
jgi:abequosyltransferase